MKVFDIWLMDSLQQENKMRNAIQYLWLKQTARSTENRVSSNRAERVTGRNPRKTRTKIFYSLRISFTSEFFFPISFPNSNILDRHQIFKYNFKNVRHNWNTDPNVTQYKIKFGYYITRKHRDKVCFNSHVSDASTKQHLMYPVIFGEGAINCHSANHYFWNFMQTLF